MKNIRINKKVKSILNLKTFGDLLIDIEQKNRDIDDSILIIQNAMESIRINNRSIKQREIYIRSIFENYNQFYK